MHQNKTYKYKRPGIRKLVFDDLDNSHYASTDLFSSVTMIVSAHPQHYNLQEQKKKIHEWQVFCHNSELISCTWNLYFITVKHNQSSVWINKHNHILYFCQWFRTFGLMLSSSPLLSLHSTCCVASPPIPKLRAWRGENSCRHTCRKNHKQQPDHMLNREFMEFKSRHRWEQD